MNDEGKTGGGNDVVVGQTKSGTPQDVPPRADKRPPGQLADPNKQGMSNRPGDQETPDVDPAPGHDGEDR